VILFMHKWKHGVKYKFEIECKSMGLGRNFILLCQKLCHSWELIFPSLPSIIFIIIEIEIMDAHSRSVEKIEK
jgi:hypothetical protein